MRDGVFPHRLLKEALCTKCSVTPLFQLEQYLFKMLLFSSQPNSCQISLRPTLQEIWQLHHNVWLPLHPNTQRTAQPGWSQSQWTHLYGVVQGRAGRVQRQVLERFDLRSFPALLLRPGDGQHVVGELFPEHQARVVRFGFGWWVSFDDDIWGLRRRRRRTSETERHTEKEKWKEEEEQSRAGDGTVIVFTLRLLAEHALKEQLGKRLIWLIRQLINYNFNYIITVRQREETEKGEEVSNIRHFMWVKETMLQSSSKWID